MKEKLTLRNVIIWSAALIGLVLFILTFFVKGNVGFTTAGKSHLFVIDGCVWRPTRYTYYVDGIFYKQERLKANEISVFILPILGALLILLATAGAVVVSLTVKNEKLAKVLSIVAGGLAVVGGAFMFFVGETAVRTLTVAEYGTLDKLDWFKSMVKDNNGFWRGGTMSLIISFLAFFVGAAFIAAPLLPEKKLVK